MRTQKEFKSRERKVLQDFLYEKCGCRIKVYFLRQLFTRKSYSVQHGGENNEIFEFIGDKVLDFYVVKFIAERFGAMNLNCEYSLRINEGHFTTVKSEIVNNKSLAKIIDEWDIAKYIAVGKCDIVNEIDKEEKVKADLFEALLGAITIQCKWNPKVLEKAVVKMLSLEERIEEIKFNSYRPDNCSLENAVTTLKELSEHGECSPPQYDFTGPESIGYDKNGNQRWLCGCVVINQFTGITKLVQASSKKMAKKAAAYLVLCDHLELQNEYGPNSTESFWYFYDGKLIPYTIVKKKEI